MQTTSVVAVLTTLSGLLSCSDGAEESCRGAVDTIRLAGVELTSAPETAPQTIPLDCSTPKLTPCSIGLTGVESRCYAVPIDWQPSCLYEAVQIYHDAVVVFPPPPFSAHTEISSGLVLGLPSSAEPLELKAWGDDGSVRSNWITLKCERPSAVADAEAEPDAPEVGSLTRDDGGNEEDVASQPEADVAEDPRGYDVEGGEAGPPLCAVTKQTFGDSDAGLNGDGGVSCSKGPANGPTSAVEHLEACAADWGVFCDRGTPHGSVATGPTGLSCALDGGGGYSAIHCYRNLSAESETQKLTLKLVFHLPATTCNNQPTDSVVQAVEFSASKYQGGRRWEIALQYNNVGDGAPGWRYWDPSSVAKWLPFSPPIAGCLGDGLPHALELTGTIVGGAVRYQYFKIDDVEHTVYIIAPASPTGEGDKLALGFQLDGNHLDSPYAMLVDGVSLLRE